MNANRFLVPIAASIAIFCAFAFLFAVETAFRISGHPLISIIMRLLFFSIFSILLLLKKREYFAYLYVIIFPFYRISFSGISLFSIMTITLIFLYAKEIIIHIKNVKDSYSNIMIVILACILYTTIIAYDKNAAVEKGLFYLNIFAAYIIFSVLFCSGISVKKISLIFVLVGIFAFVVSCLQVVFGVESIKLFFGEYNPNIGLGETYKRIPSIFNEAQFAGIFFSMMAFITMGLVAYYPEKKWFLRILSGLFIIGSLLSGTRISVVALLIGAIIIQHLLFSFRRYIVFISIILVLTLTFGLTYERILPTFIKNRIEKTSIRESAKYRFMIWERSAPIIFNNPLGVGLGGDNLYEAGKRCGAYVFPEFDIYPGYRVYTHFENSYLTVLFSLGIIGFLAFIYLIAKTIAMSVYSIMRSNYQPYKVAVSYLLSSFFIWIIGIGTSPQINHIQPMFIFVLIISMLNYLNTARKRQKIGLIIE